MRDVEILYPNEFRSRDGALTLPRYSAELIKREDQCGNKSRSSESIRYQTGQPEHREGAINHLFLESNSQKKFRISIFAVSIAMKG
jgi:hypothetical protein